MKNLYLLILAVFVSTLSYSQSSTIENVRKSLSLGSSKELVKNFDEQIEISISGNVASYNKIQAEVVLKDFFNSNNATAFNYIHHGGSSNGGLKYAIGNYTTSNSSYRVLIRFKTVNNIDLVYNIKFTKE